MGNFKPPRLLIVAVIFFIVVTVLSLDQVYILNGYFMVIINRCMIFVILASSLNLINGITGQFSLGHMGFAAVGAYVSGTITTLLLKLPPPPPGFPAPRRRPASVSGRGPPKLSAYRSRSSSSVQRFACGPSVSTGMACCMEDLENRALLNDDFGNGW